MFGIYWMNQHDKDWTDEVLYDTYDEAKEELIKQGYSLKNGWYRREAIGWEGNTRALVTRFKTNNIKSYIPASEHDSVMDLYINTLKELAEMREELEKAKKENVRLKRIERRQQRKFNQEE